MEKRVTQITSLKLMNAVSTCNRFTYSQPHNRDICHSWYGLHLQVVIVDKDVCEINAVRTVLGESVAIQLCEFHVKKAFKNALASFTDKKTLYTVLCNMLHALDENAFLEHKAELERIAPAPVFTYYMANWDNIQPMWVRYQCNKHLNLGNNTNNRVESHNSRIKSILHHSDKLHTAVHGLILMHGVRLNETEHSNIRAQSSKFYSHISQTQLVKDTSRLLTVYATKKVIDEERKCTETMDTAHVSSDDNGDLTVRTTNGSYKVSVDLSSCSCRTYLTMKLPCRHIIKVHTERNININLNLCAHQRWFQTAQYFPSSHQQLVVEDRPRPVIDVLQGPDFEAMSRTSKYNYAFRTLKQMADCMAETGARTFGKRVSVVDKIVSLWLQGKEVAVSEENEQAHSEVFIGASEDVCAVEDMEVEEMADSVISRHQILRGVAPANTSSVSNETLKAKSTQKKKLKRLLTISEDGETSNYRLDQSASCATGHSLESQVIPVTAEVMT